MLKVSSHANWKLNQPSHYLTLRQCKSSVKCYPNVQLILNSGQFGLHRFKINYLHTQLASYICSRTHHKHQVS